MGSSSSPPPSKKGRQLRLQGDSKKLLIQHLLRNGGLKTLDAKKFYRYLLINKHFSPLIFQSLKPLDLNQHQLNQWILRLASDTHRVYLTNEAVKAIHLLWGPLPLHEFKLSHETFEKNAIDFLMQLQGFFKNTNSLDFQNHDDKFVFPIIEHAIPGFKNLTCRFDLLMKGDFPQLADFNQLTLLFNEIPNKDELKYIFRHDIKHLKLYIDRLNVMQNFMELSDSEISHKNLEKLTIQVPHITDLCDLVLPFVPIFHQNFPKFKKLDLKIDVIPEVYNNDDFMEQMNILYDDVLKFKDETKGTLSELNVDYNIRTANLYHDLDLVQLEGIIKESDRFKAEAKCKYLPGEMLLSIDFKKQIDHLFLDLFVDVKNEGVDEEGNYE